MRKRVVVIPGDGAAPEAMAPTVEIIKSLNLPIDLVECPSSAEGIMKSGSLENFEQTVRRHIDQSTATLFGAASVLAKVAYYLRWGKQTYANVRPMRWRPGFRSPLKSPEHIDYVMVRENLEDTYVAVEGSLSELVKLGPLTSKKTGVPLDALANGAFALKVITEDKTRQLVRFACGLARTRKAHGGRGKITCTAKYNSLPETDGLFRSVAEAVVKEEYPELDYEQFLVDDFACRLVLRPADFDVVVIPNLYGDILSDLGGGTLGGLGLAPSGCYGADYAYFESIHGTAPDIEGRSIINPTATILSAAMMLDYLGWKAEAVRIESAVSAVFAQGRYLTPDQGGTASTQEFATAVQDNL